MDVYEEGLGALSGALAGAALTIGNFDGVHLGHQRLVERTVELAKNLRGKTAALTFWPHPARVLAPALAPPQVTSRRRRRQLLAEAGVEVLVEQPFTNAFAAMDPAGFEALLLDEAKVAGVVVGYDFTYGRKRAGTVATLRAACDTRGVRFEAVEPVSKAGLVVSSSKVREFVLAGNVEAAASLLGRPFDLEGTVVRGAGRGRRIGVPTANVAPDSSLLPCLGVYAVTVLLPDGTTCAGACNVGLNPTFQPESGSGPSSNAVSVEVHLLDRDLDLYGARLRVSFVARLRAERRFPSVDALVTQVQSDIEATRRVLGGF